MAAAIVFGAVMLYLSFTFFAYSIALLEKDPPRVLAGVMAGLAGFAFIAASVSILRDWLIVHRALESRKEKEEASQAP